MAQGALALKSTLTLPAGSAPYGVTTYGNNVYACLQGVTVGVMAFSSDPATGALTQVGAVGSTTNGPRRCRVAPDGKHLFVPATGYSEFHYFPRNADGSLGTGVKQPQPSSPVNAGLSSPTDVDISPDNAHVYVTTSGAVVVYSRNATTGVLTPIQRFALTGAFAIRCSPDGNSIFVACQSTNVVNWYVRDNNPASGTYGQIGALVSSIATPSSLPASIDITDDGKYVYECNDNGGQYTGCFFVDTVNNVLVDRSFRQSNSDTNGGAWWLALSKDAGHTSLYVALSDQQRVSQYARNTSDGTITLLTPGSVTTSYYTAGTPHSSGGPNGLAVSPSNKFLFVPNIGAATIDIFAIDQAASSTTPVSQDFVGTFDVQNRVSRDFVGAFDVRQQVQRDFIGTFDVQGQAEQLAARIVPASRTAVFSSQSRLVVFDGAAPVSRPKVPGDELYIVGDFTKDLKEGDTTPLSIDYVVGGVKVLEGPVLQGGYGVAKVGGFDPTPDARNYLTFRVACDNGEQIDRTVEFTLLDDRTHVFGKDQDDKRLYSFDFSSDAAFSGSALASVQSPVAAGVSALSSAAIAGNVVKVMIGGLNQADSAVNSCTLTAFLANTEKLVRTIYFRKEEH